jgi:FAD-linked sulfhydryl oxidase
MGDPAPVASSSAPEAPAGKLPPGMVLGPDGKPCKACNSRTAFLNWRPPKAQAGASSSKPSAAAAAAAGGAALALANAQAPADCPADVEQLGRATWTFLHTAAAYYPERPSAAHQAQMLALLGALPTLYPCGSCASYLAADVAQHPVAPAVVGRAALSRWLCERHNEVNGRLGKPIFDCSLRSTDERWKDGPGDGRCD